MTKTGKKILVADDEEGIREVFSMIIESHFDHEILPCESAAVAIETIKSAGGVDLIFCDYNMGTDNGGDLYTFLKEKNLKIPFALCSTYSPLDIKEFEGFDTDNTDNEYFQKPFTSEQIIDYITKVLSSDDADGSSDTSDYIKVNPERFLRLNQITETFNIYIKLSQTKYVKIINEGECENFDVVEKYIKKGVDYIYLEKDKYKTFEKVSMEALFKKFDLIKDSGSTEDQVEAVLDSIASIQDYAKNLGVDEQTIELIDSVIKNTEEMISKFTKLDELLLLLQSRNGYIKDHSYLTSFLACAIAERMSWKTEGIWKKIIMASLFQNISIESDEEAKIYGLNSKEFEKLDDRVRTKVKLHPQDAIKMLEGAEEHFSEDTRKMIQNHHELPDGSGFPRGLDSTKVAPLEAVFILAVNFAHTLLEVKDIDQVSIMVQDYNEYFNKGNYKKPYQGFLKAFIKLNLPKD